MVLAEDGGIQAIDATAGLRERVDDQHFACLLGRSTPSHWSSPLLASASGRIGLGVYVGRIADRRLVAAASQIHALGGAPQLVAGVELAGPVVPGVEAACPA